MKHDSFPSRWFVLVMILSALAGSAQGQSIIFVDADATGGANTGADWANAYLELQSALSAAQAGHQIWIAAGTYKPSVEVGGTGDRYKTFQLINGVGVCGGFAGTEDPATFNLADRDFDTNETILSGDIGTVGDNTDNCYHVFYHPQGANLDNTAILDGVTITAGNGDGPDYPHYYGAGMYNEGSDPTLTNCTFSENSAGSGGGMCNYGSARPTLTNCMFSENSAGRSGGGVYNADSSPTVTNCTFTANLANSPSGDASGGGMFNGDSSPTVANCTFTANLANSLSRSAFGGGMYNGGSNPTLINCTFSENSVTGDYTDGGGMYNFSSNPMVTNCTFSGNSARSDLADGGGMFNYYSSNPTVINCTFIGNLVDDDGAGMYNYWSSNPTVINCTFSGNLAGYDGGGMCNLESSPTVINCTFSGNEAEEDGGGMYNDWASLPTLANCIIWGNTALNEPHIYNSPDSSAAVTYSCVEGGYTGTGNIAIDPRFVRNPDAGPDGTWNGVDDDYGDLRFRRGSPCIDAGDNTAVPPEVTTDLDGNPRFVDDPDVTDTGNPGSPPQPIVDMGAYEYDPQADYDLDGIINSQDNCIGTPNPQQEDADGDGYGDVCDFCPGTPPNYPPDSRGCPTPVAPDFDGDLDVDQADFGHLQSCFSGNAIPQADPDCQNAKLDADIDVDQNDFAIFKACISGPNIVADPTCAE